MMNDIFLSYDRSDRPVAQKFAETLEAYGWSVWWDREIPVGKSFDEVIETMLDSAKCVVVLWSKESVQSRWVRTEASAAAERDRLVPVMIEQQVALPLEFRRIQAAELFDWGGETQSFEFQRLIGSIEQTLGQPAPKQPNRPAAADAAAADGRDMTLRRRPGFSRTQMLLAAAAVIILAVLAAIQLFKGVSPPSSSQEGSVSPGSGPSNGSTAPAAAGDGVAIAIGERIDSAKAAQTAGGSSSAATHRYTFTAKPQQTVYFRMFHFTPALASLTWQCADEDGTQVFSTCLGCTEAGVQTLMRGGRYTLTVAGGPITGVYQFQLFDVPPPEQFSVKIGDSIRDNSPGHGAGAIETPGATDMYSFTANPRQTVYFRSIARSNGMDSIRWRVVDQNDAIVFDTCLGCSEPGVQTLVSGGKYTLIVHSASDPSTGTYRLQLFDVPPPDEASIKIGDKVRPGVPTARAGAIESPGAQDVYNFTAAAGQKVTFRLLQKSVGMDGLRWQLADENGMVIFNTCLGCSEPGSQTLTRGGKYTLTVGNTGDPSTGTYGFELVSP
jgi:hypothetical protein